MQATIAASRQARSAEFNHSAWHLIFNVLQLRAGQKVVVSAAAGGVGSIAVQLASQTRAEVIALASTEKKRALTLELGAKAAADSSHTPIWVRGSRRPARGKAHAALEMTGVPPSSRR
ncbi:zinc-binding dehydrogenase [Streptomyces sp. NPDC007088]|uniref:zinc-binding dehydrogenase n=1 Tax=Streptomyces sp. NPDC007088 TaxID=3364773 RepID=UPI0036A682D8